AELQKHANAAQQQQKYQQKLAIQSNIPGNNTTINSNKSNSTTITNKASSSIPMNDDLDDAFANFDESQIIPLKQNVASNSATSANTATNKSITTAINPSITAKKSAPNNAIT